MPSIQPTNTRCASACIARRTNGRWLSIAPLEIAGRSRYGGQWNCSGQIQMEIQQFVNGVGGMPVTLYDGAIANLPGACKVVAASSINLIGTMRAINLTNLGSGWVVSTPPSGGAYTRPRRHNGGGGGVPFGANRQAGLLHRIYAGSGRADCRELSHRGPGGGTRGEHRQPAGAGAGRNARRGGVDRLSDQSPGAQLGGLPQRGSGHGAGGGRRQRAVERHVQRARAPALPPTSGRAMRCC